MAYTYISVRVCIILRAARAVITRIVSEDGRKTEENAFRTLYIYIYFTGCVTAERLEKLNNFCPNQHLNIYF